MNPVGQPWWTTNGDVKWPYYLENVPHLREQFTMPASVVAGRYQTPHAAGASTRLAGVAP